jgi:solute carrier family 13 (sodium-dependent dicarboxylate transporter), member 2/3/5
MDTATKRLDFVVDTRPLWVILLGRSVRPLLLAATALLYWFVITREAPAGLTPAGLRALATFVVCLVLWVSNALPLMITSLLAVVLLPLGGVMPAHEAYALFGNEAMFFILGVFILAACVMRSGLSTRIALVILRRFGGTPRGLLLSIFLLNAVLSFFMSTHAVAALSFPIIVEIVGVLRLRPHRSNYGRALFLAMAWGSTIGGVATLLGGARAPLALGILREATGETFSFLQWTVACMPMAAVMLVIGFVVLMAFFPIDVASIRDADALLEEKTLALGRMSYEERATAVVMLATLCAWIVLGERYGLANIALVAVIVLFASNLASWRAVEQYVNWGVILMYGGAIALGTAVNKSGAALWLSQQTISAWASSPSAAVAIISGMSIVLTEAMSNSAVVALLMPVTLGVAADFHMPVRIMALVTSVPAGLAFAFPIGTPANAIAYSSGYLRMRDITLPGATLAFTAWCVFNLIANFYWPAIGIRMGAPG